MTVVVAWSVFCGVIGGVVGFLAACLLAAGHDDYRDDQAMREWQAWRDEMAAVEEGWWH
jgi:hypothetical protein